MPPVEVLDRCDRAIVHIDLDCFYAQVEMLRLGVPFTTPFVVVQWTGLIAVNYPARAAGVQRFGTNLAQSQALCPGLLWAHVATYAPGADGWAYHPMDQVRRATHKVSLEPYREASRRIFDVLKSFAGCSVEKGGVDEAFLDVTEAAIAVMDRFELSDVRSKNQTVDEVLGTQASSSSPPAPTVEDASSESHVNEPPPVTDVHSREVAPSVVETLRAAARECTAFLDATHERMQDPASLAEAPIQSDTPYTVALFYAACLVVDRIRAALKERLGYEASAGIAKNRTLAKIISAKHKPNRQTLLLPGASKSFLFQQPFDKMRGFGGKLGRAIATHFHATTCGDLWPVAAEAFKPFTDGDMESAMRITLLVRGQAGDTDLTERSAPKSLLAQKAFQPATNDSEHMMRWIKVLTHELEQRIAIVFSEHQVRPYNFNVKAGANGLGALDLLNKSVAMPWPPDGDVMAQIALGLVRSALSKCGPDTKVNCFLLGGTVLKPDPTAELRDGKFHVSKKQSRLEDWLRQKDRPQPKVAAAIKEEDDDDATTLTEPNTDDSDVEVVEPAVSTPKRPNRLTHTVPRPHDVVVIDSD